MIVYINNLQKAFFIGVNASFAYFIYLISLRPLSAGEEQILSNYKDKDFSGFVIECSIFIAFCAIIFSVASYYTLKKTFAGNNKGYFPLLFIAYLIFSVLCSYDYFMQVKNLIYS